MITIIDSIMGSGKTTWAIQYMNRCPQRKFIFATPFLSEDIRIRNSCSNLHFVFPDDTFSKLADLKQLVTEGKNIATTHALLNRWIPSPSDIDHLYRWGYTLILDEALEVITPIQGINTDDLALLKDSMLEVNATTHQARWIAQTCPQRYNDIKRLADEGRLVLCRESQFLNVTPIKLLKAVPNLIVMTFMFEASHLCYYMRIHRMHWRKAHIQNGRLVMSEENLSQKKATIRSLLIIYEGKYNRIGDKNTALTATFWSDPKNQKERHQVFKTIRSFFLTFCHAHVNQCIWSSFKAKNRQNTATVPGFQTAFVPFNAKSTNEYRDRIYLAYAVNVHDNPLVLAWFYDHGQKPDKELFALSAMIQWIWRSAIRDGQAVSLYLPSLRMRHILKTWLNS